MSYLFANLLLAWLYNSKLLYNLGSICTKVPDKLEFELITTEIQLILKLFGDNHCRCQEG